LIIVITQLKRRTYYWISIIFWPFIAITRSIWVDLAFFFVDVWDAIYALVSKAKIQNLSSFKAHDGYEMIGSHVNYTAPGFATIDINEYYFFHLHWSFELLVHVLSYLLFINKSNELKEEWRSTISSQTEVTSTHYSYRVTQWWQLRRIKKLKAFQGYSLFFLLFIITLIKCLSCFYFLSILFHLFSCKSL